MDSFGTVLECMDGRPQRKVADYLTTSFGVRHLDTITTTGLVRHLADDTPHTPMLLANLEVSVKDHDSRRIAVVAHDDCAGDPVSDKTQEQQLAEAWARLRRLYPDHEVAAPWLSQQWILERIRAA